MKCGYEKNSFSMHASDQLQMDAAAIEHVKYELSSSSFRLESSGTGMHLLYSA